MAVNNEESNVDTLKGRFFSQCIAKENCCLNIAKDD